MIPISVRSALGGLGASTLAWLIARSQCGWALDLSPHQGGLAAVAGAWKRELNCSWPELSADPGVSNALMELAANIDEVKFFSGGTPPPVSLLEELVFEIGEQTPLVIDGDFRGSQSIVITTNQPRAWDAALSMSPDAIVVRQQVGGLAGGLLREETSLPIFLTKEDRMLRRAGELGIGIPPRSRMAEVAQSVWLWANPAK